MVDIKCGNCGHIFFIPKEEFKETSEYIINCPNCKFYGIINLKEKKIIKRKYTALVKFDENGHIICELHGAMLCVNKDKTLYRCNICHIGMDLNNIHCFIEKEVRE